MPAWLRARHVAFAAVQAEMIFYQANLWGHAPLVLLAEVKEAAMITTKSKVIYSTMLASHQRTSTLNYPKLLSVNRLPN